MPRAQSFLNTLSDFFASAVIFFASVAALAGGLLGALFSFAVSAAATDHVIQWVQWWMRDISIYAQVAVFASLATVSCFMCFFWLAVARWGWSGGIRASKLTDRQIIAAYQLKLSSRISRFN